MSTAQPVIRTEGLTKTFGAVRALDGLDLEVAPGEVHGFLGPNGSGKSTTIRIVLGLIRASGGHVELFGGDPWRQAATLHERLAYVAGDVALWPGLTGGQCLDVLGATQGGLDEVRREALIERFDLDPTKRVRDYSKGNRQKVALIAALAADADLLVLDEPTSGLDPLMEQAFQEVVRERREEGCTVLLSSHILGEVEALADRVSIIRRGRDRDDRNPGRAATAHPHPRPRGHRRRAQPASPTPRASRTTSPSGSTATSTAGSPSTPSTSTRSSAGCTPHGSTPSPPPRRAWTHLFLRTYDARSRAPRRHRARRAGGDAPMRATGLRAMLGVQWRTHRRGTLIWMFALVASMVGTAAAIAGLYTTPEKIHTYAQAVTSGDALVAINGRVEGIDSLGGIIADEFGFLAAFLLPLLGISLVAQVTRREEEAGRLEAVLGGPGRAPRPGAGRAHRRLRRHLRHRHRVRPRADRLRGPRRPDRSSTPPPSAPWPSSSPGSRRCSPRSPCTPGASTCGACSSSPRPTCCAASAT